MTDIPTAPDNKPSNLRNILANFSWHLNYDRLPPSMQTNVDEAVAAITALVPEKLNKGDSWSNMYDTAIDTTLRNFSGQHHSGLETPGEPAK